MITLVNTDVFVLCSGFCTWICTCLWDRSCHLLWKMGNTMVLIASPLPAPPAAWPPAVMCWAGWHLHMCAHCTPTSLEPIWEGIFKGGREDPLSCWKPSPDDRLFAVLLMLIWALLGTAGLNSVPVMYWIKWNTCHNSSAVMVTTVLGCASH